MPAEFLNASEEQQRQAIVDLVRMGLGPAVVEICATLSIDGDWLETLALDEMIKLQRAQGQ